MWKPNEDVDSHEGDLAATMKDSDPSQTRESVNFFICD